MDTFASLPAAERREIADYARSLIIDDGELNGYRLSEAVARKFNVVWVPNGIVERFRREDDMPRLTLARGHDSEPEQPELDDEDRKRELRELRLRQTEDNREKRYREILELGLGQYEPRQFITPFDLRDDPAETVWVLHLSDWHIGQKTEGGATGKLFYHDSDVARLQVERMLEIISEILRDGGRTVKACLVVLNGDLVEGDDMRESQHMGIDMLVAQQTFAAYDMLRGFLDGLHELIPLLIISSVGGNHDRMSRRRGNAGLSTLGYTDSYAWMIGAMLERWYDNDPMTIVYNWDTFFGHLTFNGHKIVHSHGADIKWGGGAYGGVPWYPIMRAAERYRNLLDGEFDLLMLGHGHRPAFLPLDPAANVLMNGALPPSTDFILSEMKGLRRPVQQLIELNRHGLVAYHPLYLDVGAITARGEVWAGGPHEAEA